MRGNNTTNSAASRIVKFPAGAGIAAYTSALTVLDSDMPQYVHDNTEDEYHPLRASSMPTWWHTAMRPPIWIGFARLPSSTATGAQQIGRLTNLMQLSVDTSWWTRYRSAARTRILAILFLRPFRV